MGCYLSKPSGAKSCVEHAPNPQEVTCLRDCTSSTDCNLQSFCSNLFCFPRADFYVPRAAAPCILILLHTLEELLTLLLQFQQNWFYALLPAGKIS